jgi:glycosyltransferase involved in cell wall biosynthesis
MRVLQVIETGGPGGAETVFARLSSALHDRGHHVHCVTREGSWLPGEVTRRSLPWSRWQSGGAFDLALVQRLRALIRTERIDIVHAHLFEGAVYAALAARSLGVPCIVTLHGQVDVGPRNWKGRIKARLLASSAQKIVMVSRALANDVRQSMALSDAQVSVVYNGVPVPANVTRVSDAGAHRLIAVGNIRAPKNYPGLIAALAIVRETLPDVHLDVLGEPDRGTLYSDLVAQVAQLGLENAVTFHGFVADPAPLLRQANAFVLASSKEGFSLAIVEAMLVGVPVVSTRSGGPEEIVSHDETGLLVPTGDTAALAHSIVRLLNEQALAERLAHRALAHATTTFSLEGMVGAYEQLYADALSR